MQIQSQPFHIRYTRGALLFCTALLFVYNLVHFTGTPSFLRGATHQTPLTSFESYDFALEIAAREGKNGASGSGPLKRFNYTWPAEGSLRQIWGFNKCKQLDGSVFDMSVSFKREVVQRVLDVHFNSSSDDKHDGVPAEALTNAQLVQLVESIASIYESELIFQLDTQFEGDFQAAPAERSVCFMAADAQNPGGSYTTYRQKF